MLSLLVLSGVRSAHAAVPDFALLRAEEDYSTLAGTPLNGWARIKFVPLTADHETWLSFGGEGRARYEYYRNEGWSDALNDDSGYLLTRTYLHADFHRGSFRFFGQLQSSLSEGRRGGPGPIDEDRIDLQQAFFSWSKRGSGGSDSVEVRVGRHEVQYGSARLVAARAGANTRKAFDGGLVRFTRTNQRTDLFWLSPVNTNPQAFDNDRESGRFLAGAYTTFAGLPAGVNTDVYVLLSREPARAYVAATGGRAPVVPGSEALGGSARWVRRTS